MASLGIFFRKNFQIGYFLKTVLDLFDFQTNGKL